jgi:hypothetical protein
MTAFRMVWETGLGALLLVGIMVIHGIGMHIAMHRFELRWPEYAGEASALRRELFFGKIVLIIISAHLLELLVWAGVLAGLGVIPDFRVAFYFAGETYTTVGYGDVLLPEKWRQLSTLIAMSGLLAFGWTTGVMVSMVSRIYDLRLKDLRDRNRLR